MSWIIAFAAKSLLIAGGTLLLLQMARKRSAADRSWIAHLGLVALLVLPVVHFALPGLNVPGPSFLVGEPAAAIVPAAVESAPEVAASAATFRDSPAIVEPALAIDWSYVGYGLPAALLLLLTLIAVGRLVVLKARAQVLVDTHWLSALARAQRRMGFKYGTALLTSDELSSPVSWGMMRPVIVLNTEAADAHAEAEAIIAHELAHVARLDWVKLILARVVTAIYWFNPLVWLLAREAHQLREEAADDAVLGSDIEDTDYARLLVGIARHECRGLLLGAHGVAPARNSLARRVKRVLDRALERAPGGWRWTSAAAFFAAGMAVPVAALNFVPTTPVSNVAATPTIGGKAAPASAVAASAPVDAPTEVIAQTAAAAAVAAHPHPDRPRDRDADFDIDVDPDVDVDVDVDIDPDLDEKIRRTVATATAGATRAVAISGRVRDRAIDQAMAARTHGVTAEYAESIRAASPSLRGVTTSQLVAMKIHGVKPEYVRELSRAGYSNLTADQLTNARIHGVTGDYAREMARVGYRGLSLKQVTELRMFGVTPDYVRGLQRAGFRDLSTKQLISMYNHGVRPRDLQPGNASP